MATKKRQKQNDPPSDYSDDDEDRNEERYNESFALIGTPLPDLIPPPGSTGVKDDGKFVPVWKQEVKRFHGAFTGGFSAGYYNTVGSKEGWAPSTFVSSRVSRATHNAARAEDFMDEEDLAEYTGAQNLVPTEEFDSLGFTARDVERKRTVAGTMDDSMLGVLPDKLIDDLVVPTNEPIGIRLLKKMGWREGQGIGPRAFRARKRRKFTQSATEPDPAEEEDTAIDPYARGILFAPKDTRIVSYVQKADTRGLGYDPYRNANEFRATKLDDEDIPASLYTSAKSAKLAKNSGFGTGALDDDDDDDDVYGSSSFSRSKYTSSLVEEEDEESFVVGMQRFSKSSKSATPVVKSLKITGRKFCNDGKEPMRAFVLAAKVSGLGKWFRPPVPPQGYRPIVRFAEPGPASLYVEKQYNRSSQQSLSALAAKADERAIILGEDPIDAPRRSVFDYISCRDKTRLQSLAGIYGANVAETAEAKKVAPAVPHVDRQKAVAALRGFAPFQNDASKQERYRRFLQVKAGTLDDPTKTRSEEELILDKDFAGNLDEISHSTRKEWSEFASAAEIFRPMSSLMASRFTTAGSTAAAKEFAQPEGGLRAGAEARPEQDGAVAKMIEKLVQEKEQKAAQATDVSKDSAEKDEKSMQTKAASMSMYGPLTRTISIFHPTRLVCKRFNVPLPHPEPEPGASGDGTRRRADGRTIKGGLTQELVQQMLETSRRDKEIRDGPKSPTKDESNARAQSAVDERVVGDRKIEAKANDANCEVEAKASVETQAGTESLPVTREVPELDRARPGMDIFRAIFQDSDDEDDEEEEEEEEEKPKQVAPSAPDAPVATGPRAPANPFRPMFVPKSKRGPEVEPRKEPDQKPATSTSTRPESTIPIKAPTASMTLAAALDAVRKKEREQEREQEKEQARERSKTPPTRKPRRSESTRLSSDEEGSDTRKSSRRKKSSSKSRRGQRDEDVEDREPSGRDRRTTTTEKKDSHSKRHEREHRERSDRDTKHHRDDDRKRKREEKRRKKQQEDRSPRREKKRERHETDRKRNRDSDSSEDETEKRRRKQREDRSPRREERERYEIESIEHENSRKRNRQTKSSSEDETELYGPPRPPPPPEIVPDPTSEEFHPIPKRRARAADLW